MIILAAGMPRAGSGWHYNLVHDLVVAAGGQDARVIRRRFLLRPFLTEVNCNIGTLSTKRLAPVLVPSMLGNTFAIKTHSGPSPMALRLIRSQRMRVTYIYRDPRAALLSAFEYGQRARVAGRASTFTRLETMDQAIDFIKIYLRIWKQWMSIKDIHSLRYEDLLANYDAEAERLASFLKADPDSAAAKDVFRRIDSSKPGICTVFGRNGLSNLIHNPSATSTYQLLTSNFGSVKFLTRKLKIYQMTASAVAALFFGIIRVCPTNRHIGGSFRCILTVVFLMGVMAPMPTMGTMHKQVSAPEQNEKSIAGSGPY